MQLEPGAVLSELELGERLEIGRTPVREALHRLAREGLVLILPRKGILVTEINPAKQLLALEEVHLEVFGGLSDMRGEVLGGDASAN